MKKSIGILALLTAGVLTFSACSTGKNDGDKAITFTSPVESNEVAYTLNNEDYSWYHNYIECYDDQGNIYQIGDPYIHRYDGKFYLFSSNNTTVSGDKSPYGKIPCWESTDLINWEFKSWVYGVNGEDTTEETGIAWAAFAPEIVYYKGYFYLCESQRGNGHYFFRSETPYGTYTPVSGNLGMNIDGHFYLADDGKLYFVYALSASESSLAYCSIDFINKADGSCEVVVGDTQTKIANATTFGWTEGPAVISRNGYTYLIYTGNHVDSAGYRVAYSYSTKQDALNNMIQPENNITLISTGDDGDAYTLNGFNTGKYGTTPSLFSNYRGLGHSCNTYGANLDSLYTAYHNAGRRNYDNVSEGGQRRYNLTRYFTNNSYLTADGLCDFDAVMPSLPDYSVNGQTLSLVDGFYLSDTSTKNLYTADLNYTSANNNGEVIVSFVDQNNYIKITLDGTKLSVIKVRGGASSVIGETTVWASKEGSIQNVKVISGSDKAEVYYNSMKKFVLPSFGAGKIGYGQGVTPSATQFTNDAFGTSDFNAVKNLTGTFPAYAYVKGENTGYSIKNATIKTNGVRQGEKESTIITENEISTVLQAGDWVKYNINAPSVDTYSLNIKVGKQSLGATFEVVIDNEHVYKMAVPSDVVVGESGFLTVNCGAFDVKEEKLHTMKIRVTKGTLEMVNISTDDEAKSVSPIKLDLTTSSNIEISDYFRVVVGSHTGKYQNGFMTKTAEVRTMLYLDANRGVSNYIMAVDLTLYSGGSCGLVLRTQNYSYYQSDGGSQNANCWQGYYLKVTSGAISLMRYNYGMSNQLGYYITNAFDNKTKGTITVRCYQNSIRIALNDKEVLSVIDENPILTGYTGVYAESTQVLINNFRYKNI